MSRARLGKLTDSYVESLKPKPDGRERIIRDGSVPGFLVRVGRRKRTFELRIEKRPSITRQLGHRPSGLGRLHALEQETISAAIVRALGSSRGLC